MDSASALVNGQLNRLDRTAMIYNYGLFFPGLTYHVDDSDTHLNGTDSVKPPSADGKLDEIADSDDARNQNAEQLLGPLHEECIDKTEAPLIATGGFYTKYTVSPEELDWNKKVIFSLSVADMEDCNQKTAKQIEEDLINTALSALGHGVKAVVITYQSSKWYPEEPHFRSFNFASALRKLVEKNCPPQYRDHESIQKLREEQLQASADGSSETHPPLPIANPFAPDTPMQIWVRLQDDNSKVYANGSSQGDHQEDQDQLWKWLSALQSYIGFNPKLGLCLEIGAVNPKSRWRMRRWFAERLRCLIIPDYVWKTNKAGFPILPAPLKEFVTDSHHIPGITYLLTAEEDRLYSEPDSYKKQFFCLLHLYKEYYQNSPDPNRLKWMRTMADLPIRPLQPLRDHLSEDIYSVFEKDPIKYKLYYEATLAALKDKIQQRNKDDPVIMMVVGAGRGPLVTEAIKAATELDISFKIYAVDKNPVAIKAMEAKLESEWKTHADKVSVVFSDMRDFEPEDRADIMISELIGSFGCNELSPECIDGAQRLLRPDGISIPESYTSYLQPVMATHLYEDIATFAPEERKIINEIVLVEMRGYAAIDDYKEVFTFHHPNFEAHSNEREITLEFRSKLDFRLHGFAGYFKLVLYKDISMNILPDRQTIGLQSWFPAFFPLQRPVDVKEGDDIVFFISRVVDEEQKRVWFSWVLEKPVLLSLQNAKPDNWISM